jgi:SAM-dependent methyltransferase
MNRDNLITFREIDSFSNSKDAAHMTSRDCPLCGSSRHRTVLEMRDFQFFSDSEKHGKRVDIRDCQCLDCLTLYRNPSFTPEGFNVLFAEAGCSYGSTAQRPHEQIEWLNARQLLEPGSVFLDVGCYEGNFLSQLPPNIIRMGVDVDAPAIKRGQSRDAELILAHAAFDEFTPEKIPDVISLFHVLEHLTDPISVLRRLRKISSKNARLIIEVPLLERAETNDINGFFSTQHLTHFSRHSLHQIIEKSGWKIIESEQMSDYNGYRVLSEWGYNQHEITKQASDIINLQKYFASWYKAQADVESKLSSVPISGNIIIWGAGLHTEVLYQLSTFFRYPGRRFLLVDSDPMKQGKSWRGVQITAPEILESNEYKKNHIIISSYGNQQAIRSMALQYGVPASHIHNLYDRITVC